MISYTCRQERIQESEFIRNQKRGLQKKIRMVVDAEESRCLRLNLLAICGVDSLEETKYQMLLKPEERRNREERKLERNKGRGDDDRIIL